MNRKQEKKINIRLKQDGVQMKIGIIGYGSIGKMLLWKFSESGKFSPGDLLVANRTPEKLEEASDIAMICSNRVL